MQETSIKILNAYSSPLGKRIVFLNTQDSDVSVSYLNWGLSLSHNSVCIFYIRTCLFT